MPIYLDHAATTPLRREVLDAMLPYLTESFGNPSSAHTFGRAARAGLDEAHERVARRLNAQGREIVFTSGGTEANNLALKGSAWAGKARGHRIVTSSVEHHAVGHTLRYLEKFGFEIVELPVDRYGRVDPEQLETALNDKTILVSVMLANNEVGTLQPIAEIAARVRARKGVLLHVDAVQAAPVRRPRRRGAGRGPDLAERAQVRGPQGRRGPVHPPRDPPPRPAAGWHPGAPSPGRHRGRRGCRRSGDRLRAVVCRAARHGGPAQGPARAPRPAALVAVPGVEPTGHPRDRLPGLLSVIARDTDGASVAMSLDLEGIAASVGSACTTGSTEVSHVLTAMGYPEEEARGALRLSLGRTTTDAEIDTAVEVVPRVVASMRLGTVAVAADPLGQGVPA